MHQRGWDIEDWVFLLVAAIAALCCGLALTGCGASALRTQGVALDGVGTVLDEAEEVTELQVRGGMVACREGTPPLHVFDACAAQVEARWQPLTDAIAVVVAAHNAWLDAWLAAYVADREGLDPPTILQLVTALAQAYAEAQEAAQALGVDLPQLPEVLR